MLTQRGSKEKDTITSGGRGHLTFEEVDKKCENKKLNQHKQI